MSTTTTIDVWCDGEGCGRWEHGQGARTITEARGNVRRAFDYITTYRKGRLVDLCPSCQGRSICFCGTISPPGVKWPDDFCPRHHKKE